VGTQQIITALKKIFPHTRIAQADKDVTTKKDAWKQTVMDFTNGHLDILVGTQTITKGYHFPRVTLVGIIWADLNLHFPLFNATEIALQQLIQVAGRAGRAHEKSDVIMQTMAQHSIFSYINETDYLKFYADEMASRQTYLYPPYHCLIEIELKHANEETVEQESQLIGKKLRHAIKDTSISILGPTKPLIHKIKNMHQRTLYMKCATTTQAIEIFDTINTTNFISAIFFTPLF
jgi:primosomal protein N' (replication factor Y)